MATPDKCSMQKLTRVLPVDVSKIGQFIFEDPRSSFLRGWKLELSAIGEDAANLQEAASRLRDSDTPVAFPTETVYGLGADATRSSAVRGIYAAKQRPSDNPLIVHISSLSQLHSLLSTRQSTSEATQDPIPAIYHPLISRFWPGPLTILLPLPTPSPLASEVTNSLPTVAVRMPSSKLALALIHLAGLPLAAPSANASSKPSPTTADHVLFDLAGRIDLILDGGPCEVGVESTVVDGLTKPPVILRPGGISAEMLRDCPGWEDTQVAYKDGAETGAPRAPGMKYKHYSPNARVMLFRGRMDTSSARKHLKDMGKVGILTTERWAQGLFQTDHQRDELPNHASQNGESTQQSGKVSDVSPDFHQDPQLVTPMATVTAQYSELHLSEGDYQDVTEVWAIHLGSEIADIARGLFSALRELDQRNVDVILVEGIDDSGGGARAAIMNRLRKAAEIEISL